MRTIAWLLVAAAAISHSEAGPPAVEAQPFLLFRVTQFEGLQFGLVGTLSKSVQFDAQLPENNPDDWVTMHAKLISKTAAGFHFSWSVERRKNGKIIARVSTKQLVPWGKSAALPSVAGYHVDVHYSSVPANRLNPADLTNR
jgi:hypothetical protein